MIDFRSATLEYDRIYTAQPLKGVCLFGGEFEPDDYSMVYCGAYFDQLYHIDPSREGRGTLQVERGLPKKAARWFFVLLPLTARFIWIRN